MKTFNKILIASSFLVAVSCSRELDIVQQGSPSQATFWKDEADLVAAANAMYEPFDQEEFYGRGFFWFINASDDMVTARVNGQADNIKNFNKAYVGGGYTESQWQFRYATIKRANDIFKNIDKINAPQAVKDKYLGEAYFLSGLMYFQLTSNYANEKAGVPIVDPMKEIDGTATPRAKNADENYDFLIEQLKKAAELLPTLAQQTGAEKGRAHKAAAWAILSKAYLYKKDWKNAIYWADKVINEGNRKLMPNFEDVFKAPNNYGSEYIFSAVSTTNAAGGGWGSILPGVMLDYTAWGIYNGWGYYAPTKELYDEFEDGDKRREATILKTGDKFMFDGKEMIYKSNNALKTGYMFNKYMDAFKYPLAGGAHVSTNGNKPLTDANVPIIRYAEVILIKAEAELMLGQNADAEINMIRTRAGLTPKSGCTMADLKHERRCELAGEWADRHRDLVRWGDAQATYAKPLHNMDGSVAWPARNFNPAIHNVWAVPLREINSSNGLITQNEGW